MAENGKNDRVTPAERAEAIAIYASVDPCGSKTAAWEATYEHKEGCTFDPHAVEAWPQCGPACHRSLAEHPWHDDGPFDKDYGKDVYPPGFDDQYDIDEEA